MYIHIYKMLKPCRVQFDPRLQPKFLRVPSTQIPGMYWASGAGIVHFWFWVDAFHLGAWTLQAVSWLHFWKSAGSAAPWGPTWFVLWAHSREERLEWPSTTKDNGIGRESTGNIINSRCILGVCFSVIAVYWECGTIRLVHS